MTYNQFQQEVSHIWNASTDAGFLVESCDDNVEGLLHKYAWEVGKIEIQGGKFQQQVGFLWKKFKENFPELVGGEG